MRNLSRDANVGEKNKSRIKITLSRVQIEALVAKYDTIH